MLIGPGGKMIKSIQEATGAKIDIDDDGTVSIAHMDAAGAEAAKLRVEAVTEEVRVGKVYDGKVTSIKEFGAFIEILPGRDGLCHISELSDQYVGKVDDVVKVGDRLQVKVIAIDDQDRGEAVAEGATPGAKPRRPARRPRRPAAGWPPGRPAARARVVIAAGIAVPPEAGAVTGVATAEGDRGGERPPPRPREEVE